jgi:hypothetical protein
VLCGRSETGEDGAADRNRAMASALATFLRQVGHTSTKSNTALDRVPSFLNKDKKMFKFKSNKKVDHSHSIRPNLDETNIYLNLEISLDDVKIIQVNL